MSQLQEGQVVYFKQNLTQDQWDDFRETVGFIRGRENTEKLLAQTGIVRSKSQGYDAYYLTLSDNEQWLIPTWAIVTTPIDKMQAIKDKIKYLDHKYVTRHCKEPVPQVSTDW